MRVTFHTAQLKSVLLFVHRLTATERASIQTVITGQDLTVYLTLVRTTQDDLKRFMASVPGGDAMAETVTEVNEQRSTNVFEGACVTFTVSSEPPKGGFTTIYETGPLTAPLDGDEFLKMDAPQVKGQGYVKKEYKPVSKTELDAFVKNFPGTLDYSVSGISKWKMGFWCDFSNGKVWPEAIVARVRLWDGSDYHFKKQPEYEIVVTAPDTSGKARHSNEP
jgi:hypothetical protein